MQYNLLEDRILVIPDSPDVKSSGGIFMVLTQTNTAPTTGIVIAVGPGRICPDNGRFIANPVRPNNNVMWSKFSGITVNIEGVELLLMRSSDISMTIDQTDNKEFSMLIKQIKNRNSLEEQLEETKINSTSVELGIEDQMFSRADDGMSGSVTVDITKNNILLSNIELSEIAFKVLATYNVIGDINFEIRLSNFTDTTFGRMFEWNKVSIMQPGMDNKPKPASNNFIIEQSDNGDGFQKGTIETPNYKDGGEKRTVIQMHVVTKINLQEQGITNTDDYVTTININSIEESYTRYVWTRRRSEKKSKPDGCTCGGKTLIQNCPLWNEKTSTHSVNNIGGQK